MIQLEDMVNTISWNEKAFAKTLRRCHRTLQQTIVRSCVAIIKEVASDDYGCDHRNQASHDLCKKIVETGVLDHAYLPFI